MQPLVIISNPHGRSPAGRAEEPSEAAAWRTVRDLAKRISYGEGNTLAIARAITNTANTMLEQLARGVHTNPRRAKGALVSESVRAIVYTHVDDGKFYVHGFGDANIKLSGGGDRVTISGLKDRTDVCARALPDGSALLYGGHGQPIWRDFP